MALGDTQLAYRSAGIMLQNLGDSGGRAVALKDYDYDRLGRWFSQGDRWDPRSDFMPFLAAYYYGSVPDPKKLDPVITYLAQAGARPSGEKWRWLAQAVFLARYRQEDLAKAYDLATRLASLPVEMPSWARQMPAFVSLAQGNKEAAYDIMIGILKTEAEKLPPQEVNFMVDYICTRILDAAAASIHPLCQSE
ncbi:MAG: hypothetical protein KDJ15_04605 [Alphaproteobacteria bacterium]|nr:hypothetical protein [Alphaproteobacteria bacterium]